MSEAQVSADDLQLGVSDVGTDREIEGLILKNLMKTILTVKVYLIKIIVVNKLVYQ